MKAMQGRRGTASGYLRLPPSRKVARPTHGSISASGEGGEKKPRWRPGPLTIRTGDARSRIAQTGERRLRRSSNIPPKPAATNSKDDGSGTGATAASVKGAPALDDS